MSLAPKLQLFQGYGVELEYMIVDSQTLQVKPITDKVIYDQVGAYVSVVEFAEMAWSNELVLHVIELKTNGPAENLTNLPALFQEQVNNINKILQRYNARLLPSGMHPFMNPNTDTRLWPHEYNAVYEAYNRIFNCQGHGWSNLQSTHLNLPFANDEEFGRLHAAIRLILPLIPALSASSPVYDGNITGFVDSRLEVYRQNQIKIPSIAGKVIPEAVFSAADYEAQILKRIYRDIAPHDPEGILQEEFLNSRGAIARFERNAIEIRIIDNQECPDADLAILYLIVEVLKLLVAEKWVSLQEQKSWSEEELAPIFLDIVKHGLEANITNTAYLRLFNLNNISACSAGQLWQHLFTAVQHTNPVPPVFADVINIILIKGNLSERLLRALGPQPTLEKIKQVYHELANCLAQGSMFKFE
ncbi:carboxylate-amine ligase [Adhaeribacter rhizoryzae]|uniref:Glutamate--cysteine ligase n=1 Tax=Adhaeribacter rhizoryzae TaxID=2607907 RepID=A0A5M6DMZ6_9BACT|nr:glutamate-cysteine ligase family protein [Adhaeribacter rhizoryzae]KAA5547756.1 glutamate--cysteine ligase [Adhaeribacter rhizoryzae]